MDPRTGKTKVAIDVVYMLAQRWGLPHIRAQVICPLSVVDIWHEELSKHAPNQTISWRIVNYDRVSRRETNEKGRYEYPEGAKIEKYRPHFLILDESHRCKTAGSNRSQFLWRMVRRLRTAPRGLAITFPRVLLLTGTPNPKGWIDLFAQFRIVDPSLLGTSKAQFEETYAIYGQHHNKYRIVAYRNKKQLLKIIRANSTQIPMHTIHMPTVAYEQVSIHLPSQIREAYAKLAEDFIVTIQSITLEAANAGVRALRLRQLTGGFTTSGTIIHRCKTDVLRDLLFDLQGEKVTLYANYRAEVEACAKLCREMAFETRQIDGRTSEADRTEARHSFQSPESKSKSMALVFQVQTGSLGIDLSACSEVIFFSLPAGWDSYKQACDRFVAIGKNTPIRIRHLIAVGTLDVSMIHALRTKADMHGELMRTPRSFLFGL